MEQKEIVIDTSKISPYRAMRIGRAFYNAYMEFIKDPENEKMIEKRVEEMRKERKEKEEREAEKEAEKEAEREAERETEKEAESFEKSKSIKIV